ncbi:unnamed protein product, partial [marine sediment metagenome]
MDISVILPTARDDYAIIGMPNTHIFSPLIESLNKQIFRDFELVIVDSLFDSRDTSPFDEAIFPIKHIPPKPSHWIEVGMPHSANNINTGLLHAEGELIVKIDDCQKLAHIDHLSRIWDSYNKGFIPLQTFVFYYIDKPARYSKTFERDIFKLGEYSDSEKRHRHAHWS